MLVFMFIDSKLKLHDAAYMFKKVHDHFGSKQNTMVPAGFPRWVIMKDIYAIATAPRLFDFYARNFRTVETDKMQVDPSGVMLAHFHHAKLYLTPTDQTAKSRQTAALKFVHAVEWSWLHACIGPTVDGVHMQRTPKVSMNRLIYKCRPSLVQV